MRRRFLKINKKSIYFKDKKKQVILRHRVYSYFLFANYRNRLFYHKYIIPRFRFRVFRKNLYAILRRFDRRFRIIKPIGYNKMKFIGDYYVLYDLRFYYHRLRALKLLS